MGEIADALRRARAEREGRSKPAADEAKEAPPTTADPAPEPIGIRAPQPEPPPPARVLPVFDEAEREPARIPATRRGFWQARAMEAAAPGPVTERYRHLALRVRRELEARGARTLVVTSGLRKEGKTVTSCNLALALASMAAGRRVALLDLDLRRPSVARGLGLRPKTGFDTYLRGEASIEAACYRTSVPDLDVVPAVKPMMHAHELLSTPAFARGLEALAERYALVIADSPPVLLVPDVSIVVPHFGASLFVVRSRQTSRSNMEEALGLLPAERMIGIVLNESRTPRHGGQYGYYLGRDEREDEDGCGDDGDETDDAR